jgi:hypothetical protein
MRFDMAFRQWKACAVQIRLWQPNTPQGRFALKLRKQQLEKRADQRSVSFAPELSASVKMLTTRRGVSHTSQKQIASGALRKRERVILRSEVEILAPKWVLQTGGKVTEPTCVKVAKHMRSMANGDSNVAKVVRARYG